MTYTNALKRVEKGKRIWRKTWNEWFFVSKEDGNLFMNDPCNGMPHIVRQWKYTPSEADLVATDWRVAGKVRKVR